MARLAARHKSSNSIANRRAARISTSRAQGAALAPNQTGTLPCWSVGWPALTAPGTRVKVSNSNRRAACIPCNQVWDQQQTGATGRLFPVLTLALLAYPLVKPWQYQMHPVINRDTAGWTAIRPAAGFPGHHTTRPSAVAPVAVSILVLCCLTAGAAAAAVPAVPSHLWHVCVQCPPAASPLLAQHSRSLPSG